MHTLKVYIYVIMSWLWFIKQQITDWYLIVYNRNKFFIFMKVENKYTL